MKRIVFNDRSKASVFKSDTGYDEVHFVIYGNDSDNVASSLSQLNTDVTNILDELNINQNNIVFSRLYVTDISNQLNDIQSSDLYKTISTSSFSIVQQHPQIHGKFILLGYCLVGNNLTKEVYMLNNWSNHCKITGKNYNIHFSSLRYRFYCICPHLIHLILLILYQLFENEILMYT